MYPDTHQYYGTISRLLHWLMALCFFVYARHGYRVEHQRRLLQLNGLSQSDWLFVDDFGGGTCDLGVEK